MPVRNPPQNHPCIKMVTSFDELVSTPFVDGVNALCWERTLPGDFGEIIDKLVVGKGINTIEEAQLHALDLTAAGKIAREVLLADQERLRVHELQPVLDCINGYVEDDDDAPIPTNVRSWHVDSATVAADTYLCTYFGLPSEGLPNHHAQRHVDIPVTRAKLLDFYGGDDDEDFLEFLNDHFFDLHYAPKPHAKPYAFGIHNLWRIAIQHPDSQVPPCIHRAPPTLPTYTPRLLLLA